MFFLKWLKLFQANPETRRFIYLPYIYISYIGGFMNDDKFLILELFRKNPETELSTTDIVKSLDSSLEAPESSFVSPEAIRQYKSKKAQLHRKALYHLNSLVQEGILKTTKEGKNKEKYFALALSEGEEISVPSRRYMTIARPIVPAMPIEGYEQKGVVYKLEPATWIERLNSLLLEARMFKNIKELYSTVLSCFTIINDVIALNDFESVLENSDALTVALFLDKINSKCSDYGKRICLIIDFTNLTKHDALLKIVRESLQKNHKNITFIYDCQAKEAQDNMQLFHDIIKIYSEANSILYVKNQGLHQAPYFVGRAGPYTFNENEWKIYKKEFQSNIQGLICSQVTVMVDVERFFKNEPMNASQFKQFIYKIANSLLMTNSMQRRRSEELFNNLIRINPEQARNFFVFGKNYVRFWNYGWKNPTFDQNAMLEILSESRKAADEFCISEETIYKSCGMPTRFKIAFSCCSDEFVKDIFSKSSYKSFQIKTFDDFYNEDVKKMIETKEKLFNIFNGGDVISFYKAGKIDPTSIFREMSFIFTTYRLPFFRFVFSNTKETNLKLDNFMQ